MSASSTSSVCADNASRGSGGGGDSVVVQNVSADALNARGSNCDDDKPLGDKGSVSASDGVCDDEEEEEDEEVEDDVVEEDDEVDDDDDVDGQEDDGEDEGEEDEEEDDDEETKSSVSNDRRPRQVGSRKPHTSAAPLRYGGFHRSHVLFF